MRKPAFFIPLKIFFRCSATRVVAWNNSRGNQRTRRKFLTGFIFLLLLTLTAVFIFDDFLTRPRIWFDEGLKIQLARNFADFGKIGIQLAPGEFSSSIVYNTSTGWFLPVALGAVFRVFGVSFLAARLFMAVLLLGFVALIFLLTLCWWGPRIAAFSTLLVITFAPLYGNGKSVLAEIPAFFWLMLGLYLYEILRKKHFLLHAGGVGFAIGMFGATKPAFLFLFLPAFFLVHLVMLARNRLAAKWFAIFWCFAVLAVLPTLWLGTVHPISIANLKETLQVYLSGNYTVKCADCNARENFFNFFRHTTLLHLVGLLIANIVAFAWFARKTKTSDWRVWSFALSGVLILAYFLRSPGIFRYVLPLQFLLLLILPWSFFFLSERLRFVRYRHGVASIALGIIVLAQLAHMRFFATVFHTATPLAIEQYVRQNLRSDESVGVIGSTVAAAIVPNARMKQFIRLDANNVDGKNFLEDPVEELPNVLIYYVDYPDFKENPDVEPFLGKLAPHYIRALDLGEYVVLRRRETKNYNQR